MGKAIITSNEGAGLYFVDYIYNTAALDAKIAQLKLRITDIETVEIPTMEAAITDQEATIAATINDINTAIIAEDKDTIVILTALRNKEQAVIASLEAQIAAKKGEALSVTQQIESLEAKRKESENVSAWCADYNANLSIGLEVGVMEFPGEAPGVSQPVVIRPGGINGDQNAFIASDGMMTQSIAMTPAQLYYNIGIFPAWQRWIPIYRLGTLGLIDKETDKCIVFMDNNVSSYQGLDTIPEGNTTMVDVPIEYMGIGAFVFETGDRVVVQMDPASSDTISVHGSYTGTVIGFESEPRLPFFGFKVTRDDGLEITPSTIIDVQFLTFEIRDSFGTLAADASAADWNQDGNYEENYLTYNTVTKLWQIPLSEGYTEPTNNTGFHVTYETLDSIETQYPYRYKSADKGKTEDLISIGNYDAALPFLQLGIYTATNTNTLSKLTRTIKCSVPYSVRYRYMDNVTATWLKKDDPGSGGPCDCETLSPSIPTFLGAAGHAQEGTARANVSNDGVISDALVQAYVFIPEPIQPPVVAVIEAKVASLPGTEHYLQVDWDGDGTTPFVCVDSCGEHPFDAPFEEMYYGYADSRLDTSEQYVSIKVLSF